MFLDFLKSSRRAAFLFLFLSGMLAPLGAQEADHDLAALTAIALEKNLDRHPVWHALLHQTQGKLQIRDPGFVLSAPRFSSRNELIATLAQQFGPQSRMDMRCKFPARYLWLSQQVGVTAAPLNSCDALTEYLEKVPADTISLAFASENLNQPSSMMGHIFLKLSGKNREDSQGQIREHAVSFYTDADTINLPKLLFQNAFSGMPGWYSVAPYQEVLTQYTRVEDRNVWDFEIRMDAWTNRLLRLHLFELRDVEFKYYFHSYNCATLIDELLTLVQAQVAQSPPADPLWTTPKDVVKRAHALGLIGKTQVTPAQTWLVRGIEKQLTAQQIRGVKQWASEVGPETNFENQASETSTVLTWHLASTYNDYLYQNQQIDLALWTQHQVRLAESTPSTAYELQVPDTAQVQNAPGDSQFSWGHTVRDGRAYASASYLPASHTLLDDSAQGLAPNALMLMQATVFKSLTSDQFFIDEFVVYASQTLLPRSELLGGVSRAVRLAYERQYSQYSQARHTPHATSSWGFSYPIGADILAYADVTVGAGATGEGLYWEASPGAGLLVNGLWGMKTHAAFRQHHNALGQGGLVKQLALTQRWRLSASNSIEMDWGTLQGNDPSQRSTNTTWRWKIIF